MLAEFIDRIVGLARGSHELKTHTHPFLPRKVLVTHAQELVEHEVPPPFREHTLETFASVVAAKSDLAKAAEVYVSEDEIVMFLDSEDRREHIKCPLIKTERFQVLQLLQRPQQYTVRDAVKLLRFELHGPHAEALIQVLRRVDFKRGSAGEHTVEHGKESLGKSVEAAVQQADKIPETFHAVVPIWTNRGFQQVANVTVGVYLDAANETVELRVLADEVSKAMDSALLDVVDELTKSLKDVPVFQGRPW